VRTRIADLAEPINQCLRWLIRKACAAALRAWEVGKAIQVKAPRWKLPTISKGTSRRSVAVPAVLGTFLVGTSFVFYSKLVRPPTPPRVDGATEIYVSDPQIETRMEVIFDPTRLQASHSKVVVRLTFINRQAPQPPATSNVFWALVLYRDARFVDSRGSGNTILPPGAKIRTTRAADPPFVLLNRDKEDAQIISGTSYLGAALLK